MISKWTLVLFKFLLLDLNEKSLLEHDSFEVASWLFLDFVFERRVAGKPSLFLLELFGVLADEKSRQQFEGFL